MEPTCCTPSRLRRRAPSANPDGKPDRGAITPAPTARAWRDHTAGQDQAEPLARPPSPPARSPDRFQAPLTTPTPITRSPSGGRRRGQDSERSSNPRPRPAPCWPLRPLNDSNPHAACLSRPTRSRALALAAHRFDDLLLGAQAADETQAIDPPQTVRPQLQMLSGRPPDGWSPPSRRLAGGSTGGGWPRPARPATLRRPPAAQSP